MPRRWERGREEELSGRLQIRKLSRRFELHNLRDCPHSFDLVSRWGSTIQLGTHFVDTLVIVLSNKVKRTSVAEGYLIFFSRFETERRLID